MFRITTGVLRFVVVALGGRLFAFVLCGVFGLMVKLVWLIWFPIECAVVSVWVLRLPILFAFMFYYVCTELE